MKSTILEGIFTFGLMLMALVVLILSAKVINTLCLMLGLDSSLSGLFSFVGVIGAVGITVGIMVAKRDV